MHRGSSQFTGASLSESISYALCSRVVTEIGDNRYKTQMHLGQLEWIFVIVVDCAGWYGQQHKDINKNSWSSRMYIFYWKNVLLKYFIEKSGLQTFVTSCLNLYISYLFDKTRMPKSMILTAFIWKIQILKQGIPNLEAA